MKYIPSSQLIRNATVNLYSMSNLPLFPIISFLIVFVFCIHCLYSSALVVLHLDDFKSLQCNIIILSVFNTWVSHAGTVVPECFKDDDASQWKSGKFDPRSLKNPRTDRHLNLHG